jgi:hypothetical protein
MLMADGARSRRGLRGDRPARGIHAGVVDTPSLAARDQPPRPSPRAGAGRAAVRARAQRRGPHRRRPRLPAACGRAAGVDARRDRRGGRAAGDGPGHGHARGRRDPRQHHVDRTSQALSRRACRDRSPASHGAQRGGQRAGPSRRRDAGVALRRRPPPGSRVVHDPRRADGAGVLATPSPRARAAGRSAGAGRRAVDHVPAPPGCGARAILVGTRASARRLRPRRVRDHPDRQPHGAEAPGRGGLRAGPAPGEQRRRGAPCGNAAPAARPGHASHDSGRADPSPPRVPERRDASPGRDARRLAGGGSARREQRRRSPAPR